MSLLDNIAVTRSDRHLKGGSSSLLILIDKGSLALQETGKPDCAFSVGMEVGVLLQAM